MAEELGPGKLFKVTHDVLVNDDLAFKQGETVVIESIQPNQQRPEYKYVVLSTRLGERFQLSEADVSSAPQHDNQIPDKVKLPKCKKCSYSLGPHDLVCGECGTANVQLVAEKAKAAGNDPADCDHRYISSVEGYACVLCGTEVPRSFKVKPPRSVRCYQTCQCCDKSLKGKYYCTRCGAKIVYGKNPVGTRIPGSGNKSDSRVKNTAGNGTPKQRIVDRRISPFSTATPSARRTATNKETGKRARFGALVAIGIVLVLVGGSLAFYGFINVDPTAATYDEARSLDQQIYDQGLANKQQLEQDQRALNYDQSLYATYKAENPVAGGTGVALIVFGILGIVAGGTGIANTLPSEKSKASRPCPSCGAMIPSNAVFCRFCKTAISLADRTQVAPSPSRQNQDSTLAGLAGAVIDTVGSVGVLSSKNPRQPCPSCGAWILSNALICCFCKTNISPLDRSQVAPMTKDTKECPYCAETIKAAAIKCKHCGSDLTQEE